MYLLVEWISEVPKTWTVISVNLLADGNLRKGKNLVGRAVGVNWKKRAHQALVVDSGNDETALERTADALAERRKRKCVVEAAPEMNQTGSVVQSSSSEKSKPLERATRIQSVLEDISVDFHSTSNVPIVRTDAEIQLESNSAAELNTADELESMKQKYKNLKKKYRTLKETHKQCTSDDAVELLEGSGIRLLRTNHVPLPSVVEKSVTQLLISV
ncbi:unnamed protein product [Allacma fusca]|uniref:Uncharacterized protein n=1 Tax=Allacma fusca TaxID=39272 RepID=A0A8J2Q1H1_9HEXA|nr:unnamed protein product [Allacma fusca]